VPTNSRNLLAFTLDAYRLAMAATNPPPVDLITTQDMFLSGLVGVRLRHRLRVPLLVQNHSYIFGNQAWMAEHPFRNRLLLWLAHFVLRRADMIRTVNQKERQNAIVMGFTPERAISLPLATASSRFAESVPENLLAERRAALGLDPDHKIVLWVGYPVAFKRVPLLFKVFRRVAEHEAAARLLLIGDMSRSPQDLRLAAQSEGIADRVVIYGPVAHDELPSYYALANVYVHTSSYEGVPRVLFEAAAAGLPLIGMNAIGVDEVIEDGINGYLVPDGDIEAMASRILELLHDSERAHTLGNAAQQRALERYNTDDYVDKWVNVWQRAVELGLRA
jgi:glycosyltransferase involved in cell wall biosynthesis